ncbi:hypothetical protein EI94DRAFT_1347925 [Lactarius quietus]|nr:hypothetical protein EI94DRAFT_1347925 [Lactarius quietus]
MTTTNPIKVYPRTWYSEHMSLQRRMKASAPSNSGDLPTSSQATMNVEILQQFKRAIFAVDLTAQGAPLQAGPDDVQKVFDHLRDNCKIAHTTLFGDGKSTKDAPRLPPCGFKSVGESYEPLTHVLNAIVRAVNCCLTHTRYLKDLSFDRHGAGMREMVKGKPLKPKILGLLHPRTPDEPDISWNNVAVLIEVKSQLIEAVKHLATHKEPTLYFLCFHRSGISISPQLHLDERMDSEASSSIWLESFQFETKRLLA